jgi:hypothetical protein
MAKIKLSDGSTMNHGAIFRDANLARNGSPKRLTDPALVPGAKRQTKGSLHPYLHGTRLCDEPNNPDKLTSSPVPVHPGMTSKQVANVHLVANDPNAVLQEAGRLGRPVGGYRK